MFRFKIVFIFSLLLASFSWAQENSSEEKPATSGPTSFNTIGGAYMSWTEFVDLSSGGTTDRSFANFYGTGIFWEREKYFKKWGSALQVGGFFGQANAGCGPVSGTGISYQTNYRSWLALEVDYRLAYRLTPQINLSIGPFVLARQVSFPSDYNGTSVEVKSGSALNYGATANLNYRLTPRWEIRQMIGTMAVKASTIWALAFGYKF